MPTKNVLRDAGLENRTGLIFRRGTGCEACHNSGFRGRAGVYAVMEVTDGLRRLIHHASAAHELRDLLKKQGVLTLREEGVRLALDGKTPLEEVLSVTHSEDIAREVVPASS